MSRERVMERPARAAESSPARTPDRPAPPDADQWRSRRRPSLKEIDCVLAIIDEAAAKRTPAQTAALERLLGEGEPS